MSNEDTPAVESPTYEPEPQTFITVALGADLIGVDVTVNYPGDSITISGLDLTQALLDSGHSEVLKIVRKGYPAQLYVDPASAVAALVSLR